MSFNLQGAVPVSVEIFGSLVTENQPLALVNGVSPDSQDVVHVPGSVGSRPALQKVFNVALPAGGPNNQVPTVVNGWSSVGPDGATRNFYFDSNGVLWIEYPLVTPGAYAQLLASTPGSCCKAITAFGRDYIAISDGLHGTECGLQYDGTNIDRVTQDGPGVAPVATALSLPSVAMAVTAAGTVFGVTSITTTDPTVIGPPFAPTTIYISITITLSAPTSAISQWEQLTVAGNGYTPFNHAWTVSTVIDSTHVKCSAYFQASQTGAGGSATGTGGVTLVRSGGIVTANTTAAHQLQPGFQAQISGMTAAQVGGGIASILIDNEDLPGEATITTVSAHGLVPGLFVSLAGIPAAVVGTTITAITRNGQLVTVTTSAPHGLSPGALVTLAGNTPTSFNTTALVLNVISSTVFTFAQVDVDAVGTVFGTVSLNWPIPNSATPTYFEVLSAPTATTFQVQMDYSDGAWGAGGTVTYAWNGTFFVLTVPSPTSFTYKQPGPDATSSVIGTVTPYGQMSPGSHQLQVLFLTRNDAITEPSPPITFTANGGQYASITNIPIGPPNVIARILAFTGASGAYFFYIPATPQINGQIVGTSTQLNDNTSTSLLVDFSDTTLFNGISISEPGNQIANQDTLDGALGFGFYASRLVAYGQRNKLQNLLNMGFDGGYSPAATTTPAGWSGATGALVAAHFGMVWQAAPGATLSQGFAADAYGDPIATPKTPYLFRCWLKAASGAPTLTATISSASTGFSSTATLSPVAWYPYQQAAFSLPMPTAIPRDLVLKLTVGGSGSIQVDDCAILYAAQPYRDTTCYGSYENNPEAFDGVSGVFGPADDTRKIMEAVTMTVGQQTALYLGTQDPSGRLHKVINNGTTEPTYWPLSQVGANCGMLSAFCTTKSQADDSTASGGEEWFAWASASGARIYDGNQPWKISQENQPIWDAINPLAAPSIWAVNDPVARRMYFGLPLNGATAPSIIYPIDYRELDTAYQIAQSPPIHTSFSGRLIATDHTRKSTRWNMTMNGAALMYHGAGALSLTFFGGNAQGPGIAAGHGNVYVLNAAKYTDDDYGQIYPYYTTYFFVTPDQAQMFHLSAGQNQVAYLLAFASGVGNLVITPLINNLSTAWPLTCTRALSAAPPNQIEWPGGDVVAQRFAIKIASTPSSGTDNAFNLYGLTLGLVPAAMLPVRGAL